MICQRGLPARRLIGRQAAVCIPFEDSLSEEQIEVFHKILDCVSDTAAAEMRAAYKFGFKDGVALMIEINS